MRTKALVTSFLLVLCVATCSRGPESPQAAAPAGPARTDPSSADDLVLEGTQRFLKERAGKPLAVPRDRVEKAEPEEYKVVERLMLAAEEGHVKALELLLAAGADVNQYDRYGQTPLSRTCREGHLEPAKFLLDHGADPNAGESWKPLACAVAAKGPALVSLLIERGARVNDRVEPGAKGSMPALHVAAMMGNVEMAELLLKHGADVDAKDPDGVPAIDEALFVEKDVAPVLLARGAKLDVFAAAGLGKTDALRDLLARDPALAKAVGPHGNTPLHFAARCGRGDAAEILLAAGADPDAGDKYKTPVLWEAAANGDARTVKLLMDHGCAVDAPAGGTCIPIEGAAAWGTKEVMELFVARGVDVKGRKPSLLLLAAANRKHPDVIQCLLDKGMDANARDENGKGPLDEAAVYGNLEGVRILTARGADINAPGRQRTTPLHMAALFGRKRVAEFLLAGGAKLMARDEHGNTPLHAAAHADFPGMTAFLVSKGADPNALNNEGLPPLAAMFGRMYDFGYFSSENEEPTDRLATVKALLAHGADANWKSETGRVDRRAREFPGEKPPEPKPGRALTVLHLAAEHGDAAQVQLLLAAGGKAQVNCKTVDGDTPLHVAAEHGRQEIVQLLLDSGADVNAVDERGRTPLLLALDEGMRHQNVRRIELLIARGADVNIADQSKRTPLHMSMAFLRGNKDIAMLLLKSGADVNAKDYENCTPLHFAAERGFIEVINVLLDRGVEINPTDTHGCTPLDHAIEWSHPDAAKLLRAKGGKVIVQKDAEKAGKAPANGEE